MPRTLFTLWLAAAIASAAAAQGRHPDLAGHWAEARVSALVARGVLDAGNAPFRPDAPISRQTFLQWLMTARGRGPEGPLNRVTPDTRPDEIWARTLELAVAAGVVPAGESAAPTSGLTREEAIGWVVRAADLGWEADGFTHAALPASDADDVTDAWRGAVAVALLGRPALLREPSPARVRPRDPLTRAEAASLLWAFLQAAESEYRLEQHSDIARGVRLATERRGLLRSRTVWRVTVPINPREDAARQLAAYLQNRGYAAQSETVDNGFRVRLPSFTDRAVAERVRQLVLAAGESASVTEGISAPWDAPGPIRIAMLRIEPGAVDLLPIRARDAMTGREATSSMAERRGALAAVNAGYFAPDGATIGGLAIDGVWISEPYAGRTCAAVTSSGDVLFDALTWSGQASTPTGSIPLHGLNRPRRNDEVVLYNRWYGPTTRSVPASVEVVVVGNVVREVRRSGGTAIPASGFVLSAGGAAAPLLDVLKVEDAVSVAIVPNAASGDPRWSSAYQVFCGGPRLLANGQVVAAGERFNPTYLTGRNPRAGIGVTADGTIYVMVVDGRRPTHSYGMTAVEFAMEMRKHGVLNAVHLDGGGSATLVVRGHVVSRPSDAAGERAVADAVLFFARNR